MSADRWLENPFRAGVLARLAATRRHQAHRAMRWDGAAGAWTQECVAGAAVPPVPLQSSDLVVDVTDHGMIVLPLQLDGRFAVELGATVGEWSTRPADDGVRRRLLVRPGSVVLECVHGVERCEIRVHMSDRDLHVDITADGVACRPHLTWIPGELAPADDDLWLRPASMPAPDDAIARNNSAVPDPPRPTGLPAAGLLLSAGRPLRPLRTSLDGALLLGDAIAAGAERVDLGLPDATEHRLVLTGARDAEAARREARSSAPSPLAIAVPDDAILRQAAFSAYHGVFSRARRASGRSIFVHGRRDRGYGDVAHLHQSYQMHLPALAAGRHADVLDELVEFAALQQSDGSLLRSPRPGAGDHPYVGLYTNAHFLLALHRYLAWTGDADGTRSLLGAGRAAAGFLLANRAAGMLRPCGWLDAWPPDVVAQVQVTATGIMGLRAIAEVEAQLGRPGAAHEHAAAADALADAVRRRAYDETTGLFAEHVFADGRVEGGTVEDFWAHTQIWTSLAGLAPDARALDLVRRHCFTTGVRVVPVTSFASAYIAASTDGDEELAPASTATWLLAMWPELTHLYALAELRHGRPDAALDAVATTLPERLHARNPVVAPYFYAEKYLHPGDEPWLCTWAGDPTLVDVLLTGFLGVRPDLGGLHVTPQLPGPWAGRELSAQFACRGATWRLVVDPSLDPGTVQLDERTLAPGAVLSPTRPRHEIRVGARAIEPDKEN